jgi:hypothetical protein
MLGCLAGNSVNKISNTEELFWGKRGRKWGEGLKSMEIPMTKIRRS